MPVNNVNTPSNPNLLFLVGVPRSGTTWLQAMLGNHPRICTAQESHLFNHAIGPVLDNWSNMLKFDDGRGGIGLPAYLTEDQMLALMRRTVYEVFSHVKGFTRCDLFVEKTPDHILRIRDIAKVIPTARFVLLVREPRDVVESLLAASRSWGHSWAPRSTLRAARQVSRYTQVGIEGLKAIPESRWLVVRYEQLKQDPETELRRVLQFADIGHSDLDLEAMTQKPGALRRFGEFARLSGPKVTEPDEFHRKEKGKLSMRQRTVVDLVCRDQHRRLLSLSS